MSFKEVPIPDDQPSFPFRIGEDEWHIFSWLMDGSTTDVFRLMCQKVTPAVGGGYGLSPVGAVAHSIPSTATDFASLGEEYKIFLSKVEDRMQELYGNEVTPPFQGSQAEILNWLITNCTSFDGTKFTVEVPTE